MPGEVAVHQHGTTHAVQAPGVDGRVDVDLPDGRVTVTSGFEVAFRDDDGREEDLEVETDGGTATAATSTQVRGVTLKKDQAEVGLWLGAALLLVSGVIIGNGSQAYGFVAAVGAAALTWFCGRSYWGGDWNVA